MALERHTIERKDFPIGRRGYEPEAVDAHLRAISDEVEDLKRSAQRPADTLASTASEQVRSIVEAAEASAAEIRRQAEEEARSTTSDANSEAKRTREEATEQAREFVAKVSDATSGMLDRLGTMDSELNGLLDSLRSGSNKLVAELQQLAGDLGEMQASLSPRDQGVTTPEPTASAEAQESLEPEHGSPVPAVEPTAPPADSEPPPEPPTPLDLPATATATEAPAEPPEPSPAEAGHAAASGNGDDDLEGARLVALNMALNGTPRAETDRYLAENFQLADRSRLLDEVYESVEG